MKNIYAYAVDVNEQRYGTCGDYWEDENTMHFRITKQPVDNWDYAVLLHEFIEFILCRNNGISEETITNYDLEWEERYERGATLAEEPGDEIDCPYHKEHMFAKQLERMFADALGIEWDKYNDQLIYQQTK